MKTHALREWYRNLFHWCWWSFKRICYVLGFILIFFWVLDYFTIDGTEQILQQIEDIKNDASLTIKENPNCYEIMKDDKGECIPIKTGEGRTP
ncbi:MAG: hypothetical protein ACK5YK_00130 [Pseudomonadota bacterium]|jgi:hypothetical protein